MFLSRIFHRKAEHTYLKNFLFGVEDSLVSTVGLLAGVAAGGVSRSAIITTGLVLIVVEGFSMGIGSFLTEETAEEMTGEVVKDWRALGGGLTMLFSYIIAGLIPLSPYFFLSHGLAMPVSIAFSLAGLFGLGLGTSLYFHHPHPLMRSFKMLILGGLAVGVGVLIGHVFHL